MTGETKDTDNPTVQEADEESTTSMVAVAGHPLHAMSVHFPIAFVIATLGADLCFWWTADPFWVRASVWSAGFAFVAGLGAALVGTAELLLVPGIRIRVASWTHAVAAMTLLAVAGTNWGLRLAEEISILPSGLLLSLLASIMTGLAGWHGGKLVFDHGIGLIIGPKG